MILPEPFARRIAQLFEQMDHAYDAVADNCGFVCNGCEDNCCMTRFYHFTVLEWLYLHRGLQTLPDDRRAAVQSHAAHVVDQMQALEGSGAPVRVMCPLNQQGRCVLYAYRPMICRLHGIPHAMQRPDNRTMQGPGCADFDRQCGPSNENGLDRTPLYAAMAKLEQALRQELGFKDKIKMTIAEMIVNNEIP